MNQIAGDDNLIFLFLFILMAWTLPWKGIALWKAARSGHKIWFIALLVANTLAILEIVYIFIFSRKTQVIEAKKPENK